MSTERSELLAKVARMYFLDGMTQQQISSRLGYSRSCISRYLKEAKQEGIVEITIHEPLARVDKLEKKILGEFNLKEVRVLDNHGNTYLYSLKQLGAIAAEYLSEKIIDNRNIGISWGTSVYELVNAIQPIDCPWVNVVQVVGSAPSAGDQDDGPRIARTLAHKLNGKYFTLSAPWIISDRVLRDALMDDLRLKEILELIDEVDMVIEGIGLMDPDLSCLVRVGHLSVEEVIGLRTMGIVGDVCGNLIDIDGNLIDIPRIGYAFGISPEKLKETTLSVGLACGEKKAPAILGAIRSGLINTLVIDNAAAIGMLQLV